MNLTLVTAAVTAAMGFGLGWQLQGHQITKLELDHAQERIEIQRAGRIVADRASTAVIVAQNHAASRAVVARRESDAVRASVDGLRDDLDVTRRAATSTIDACNSYSATLGKLLVASATVNQQLAQVADGHASDIRTLIEAWPK